MDRVSIPIGKKESPLEFKDGKYHIGNIIMEPEQAMQMANWILNHKHVSDGNTQAAQNLMVVKQSLQTAIQCMMQLNVFSGQLSQPIAVLQELLRSS